MTNERAGESGPMNLANIEDTALNTVELVCSVIARPVELILRPQHGTEYFKVPVIALSTVLMVLMPAVSAVLSGAMSLIPFSRPAPIIGLFGLMTAMKLYFLLSMFHGIRHYRLMIHMELEEDSEFEGPALPFFALVPKFNTFWATRIVLEPAFVFIVATALGRIFIFQAGLTTYLQVAAFALAMKNFIGWYVQWRYIRQLMNARFRAPILTRLAANEATDDDLATIHLASFPKNIDPEIRSKAAFHIAKDMSAN